jgi:hypothetical protein
MINHSVSDFTPYTAPKFGILLPILFWPASPCLFGTKSWLPTPNLPVA